MELDVLDHIYPEVILDHCRNPRNASPLEEAAIRADGVNPFCGDEVHLQIRFDRHGRASEVGLQGVGCSINQATGSMLTEVIRGKTVDEIAALSNTYQKMMHGEVTSAQELGQLGDLKMMEGVRQFPVRIKCALLAWSTLDEGLEVYRHSYRRKGA